MVERAFALGGGSQRAAARLLGLKRTTLLGKLLRAQRRGHRLGRFVGRYWRAARA